MKTMTDTEIKLKGIELLIDSLGEVETERFISLILREPFDYTEWQAKLWRDETVEEISRKAMTHREVPSDQSTGVP
jgi:hypothetical protein